MPDVSEMLPPDEPLQLIDPKGNVVGDLDKWGVGDLTDEQLLDMHRYMVVARRADAQAITLQRQGQLGVYASMLGQEAAQIGSAMALRETDWVFPSYREMGVYVVRGLEPGDVMQLYRGSWLCGHDPIKSRMGMLSIPIGTQTLHAVGFAMGERLRGNDTVVIGYVGDGGTSEGDVHEALNFAAVYNAPAIIFVQNNQWAISVPLSSQMKAPNIATKAVGYGLKGYRCDGNDVLATLAVTRKAVEAARNGEPPALIEAMTYRMEAHTTADDPTRYRTKEELAEWEAKDPIVRYEAYLNGLGLIDDAHTERVQAECDEVVEAMREKLFETPHGDPLELFEHVRHLKDPWLESQRDMLAAELEASK